MKMAICEQSGEFDIKKLAEHLNTSQLFLCRVREFRHRSTRNSEDFLIISEHRQRCSEDFPTISEHCRTWTNILNTSSCRVTQVSRIQTREVASCRVFIFLKWNWMYFLLGFWTSIEDFWVNRANQDCWVFTSAYVTLLSNDTGWQQRGVSLFSAK